MLPTNKYYLVSKERHKVQAREWYRKKAKVKNIEKAIKLLQSEGFAIYKNNTLVLSS